MYGRWCSRLRIRIAAAVAQVAAVAEVRSLAGNPHMPAVLVKKKKKLYMRITESLCCTVEINTIL